jgi:predicted  nucleic acid-binding Zn-ribbon protein
MSLKRKLEVDLKEFYPDFSEGKLYFYARTFGETQEFTKKKTLLAAKVSKVERDSRKLTLKYDAAKTDKEFELVDKELDKLAKQVEDANEELREYIVSLINNSFESGYYIQANERVEVTKEDLGDLDQELVQHVLALLTGNLDKKK